MDSLKAGSYLLQVAAWLEEADEAPLDPVPPREQTKVTTPKYEFETGPSPPREIIKDYRHKWVGVFYDESTPGKINYRVAPIICEVCGTHRTEANKNDLCGG